MPIDLQELMGKLETELQNLKIIEVHSVKGKVTTNRAVIIFNPISDGEAHKLERYLERREYNSELLIEKLPSPPFNGSWRIKYQPKDGKPCEQEAAVRTALLSLRKDIKNYSQIIPPKK